MSDKDMPAFPVGNDVTQGQCASSGGMTLRDYFAAKALQGMCADPAQKNTLFPDMAALAYSCADEMLKVRAA